MSKARPQTQASPPPTADGPGELDLTDGDILEAMREIPGYLDITTADFRSIYHLAHRHAVDRLFQGVTAGQLMRTGFQSLGPETPLRDAIPRFVGQGLKTLPVLDQADRVLGILTETDILRALGAGSFLELLERWMASPGGIDPGAAARPVGGLMTSPVVTLPQEAGRRQILAAFAAHPGRGTPVLGPDGRLTGLLLRKDFLRACHLEGAE